MLCAAGALADGGTVRAIATDDGLQISVFTSPVVLAAGEVDVSVLVQDAETLAALPSAQVEVELVPQGRPYAAQRVTAEQKLATNKLFQACHLTLSEGKYDVVVTANLGKARGRAAFEMAVGPEPTRAAAFWPWYCWPAVPVLLWITHVFWQQRRNTPGGPPTNRRAENCAPLRL